MIVHKNHRVVLLMGDNLNDFDTIFKGKSVDDRLKAVDLLQGKFQQGLEDTSRVVWNTTLGIGGLFDPATSMGLPKHREDFGQTLGVWFAKDDPGPYLVIPVLGPSSFRDGVGLIGDIYTWPVFWATSNPYWTWGLATAAYIDIRSQLLETEGLAEIAADLSQDERREIINSFVDEADSLADLNGLERVKMTGDGYYAVCGTETPYLDHTQRALTFAAQLRDALTRYGEDNDLPISMRAGIDTGTVTVGLIGDTRLVYDLWGEAVDNATMLSRTAQDGEILITTAARDRTTIATVQVDAPGLGDLNAYRLTTSSTEGAST